MTTYFYIRVSTDQQNCANQRFELDTYAAQHGLKPDEYIEETISSRKPLEQRKLGKLLKKLQPNDVLLTSEISRLGRSIFEVMGILQQCLEKGCAIITVKENYRLGSDIQSKMIAVVLSLVSELERQLISQRTTETLKRLKNEGKHLGRPYGFSYQKLRKKHQKIVELLEKGMTKAEIARLFGCSWLTIHRYVKKFISIPTTC
jgi:DNA invertase Pin-like site-specific DNA recombinase